jgi:hypothetical protein
MTASRLISRVFIMWLVLTATPVTAGMKAEERYELDAFKGARKIFLYSLDPSNMKLDAKAKKLNGWVVLGMTELKKKAERSELTDALKSALASAGEDDLMCFNPRHAVRVVGKDGKETIYTICYECRSMTIKHGMDDESVRIGPKGERTLNALLTKAGLPLAPKKP